MRGLCSWRLLPRGGGAAGLLASSFLLLMMVVTCLGFDLSDIQNIKAPGLCMYYDGQKCRYKSTNGIKTSSDGLCPSELKGIVPICKGQPDPFIPSTKPPPAPSAPPALTTSTPTTATTKPASPPPPSPPTPPPPQVPASREPPPLAQVEISWWVYYGHPVRWHVDHVDYVARPAYPPLLCKPVHHHNNRNNGPPEAKTSHHESNADKGGDTQEPPIPPPPSVKDSGGQHKPSRIDSQTVLILGVSVGILVTALLAMVAGAIIVAFRIKKRQQRVQEIRLIRSESRTQVNQLSNPDLASMVPCESNPMASIMSRRPKAEGGPGEENNPVSALDIAPTPKQTEPTSNGSAINF